MLLWAPSDYVYFHLLLCIGLLSTGGKALDKHDLDLNDQVRLNVRCSFLEEITNQNTFGR